MGKNIDLYKMNYDSILNDLKKYCNIKTKEDEYKLEEILDFFGNKIDNYYIILWQEFFEDYNSMSECSILINKEFNVENSFEILLSNQTIECIKACIGMESWFFINDD